MVTVDHWSPDAVPAALPRVVIENSTRGLTLLDPDHEVAATHEEHHQAALAAYAPHADGRPRRVAVELVLVLPTRAAGPGIEVRLDGSRVGQLTPRMAQRYAPLLDDVLRRGGRPGCIALVDRDHRGLQVELRLPRMPAGPCRPPAPPLPPEPAPGPRRSRRPYLIGAGVVVLVGVVGLSLGSGDPGSAARTGTTSASASASSSTAPPTAAPASPPPVTPPAAAPAPAAPVTDAPVTDVPATDAAPGTTRPSPSPSTPRAAARVPEPTREPEPVAEPEPAGDCDPNYSGCVPVASDVDCAGGSGNGPAYVEGPVRVTGADVYGLDADDDGTGCDA